MEQAFIWSEPQLTELIKSPRPGAREWAVTRLFELYPESAASRTLSLLQSDSETIVLATLRGLGRKSRPECLPVLRRLYAEGNPAVSALVLHVLSNWRVEDAVDWLRDKVFSGARFSSDEIAAMLRLLGLVPGERAYELLKGTEGAIQTERSWKWQVFYAALLRHGKGEDLGTLIAFSMNGKEPDEYRMSALELLLERVDPTINPTDVFYGNHPVVREHLLGRLEYLDASTRDTATPVSGDPVLHDLAKAIGSLKMDDSESPLAFLRSFAASRPLEPGLSAELFTQSLKALHEGAATTEAEFPLYALAFSGLIRHLFDRFLVAPGQDASWEEKVDYVLKRPGEWEPHDPEWQDAIQSAPRDALVDRVVDCVESDPGSWKSLHAMELLGELKAVGAAPVMLRAMEKDAGEYARETATEALRKMGAAVLPELLPLLDSSEDSLRKIGLDLLSHIPTQPVVEALSSRMATLLERHRVSTLAAFESIAAQPFLSLLEQEYRAGEWDIARTCVHIAHIHDLQPSMLSEMERDVREADQYARETGSPLEMPSALRLELLCNGCRKPYHYLVSEIHLHPPGSREEGDEPQDMTPYRQGIVIADEIRCKNCRALNDFSLTRTSLAQLSSHGMMMQTMSRLGMEIPRHNPIQVVRVPDKAGKERPLTEIEQEHLEAVQRHPGRPESHLAAGKFYEYVKVYPKAKEAYLLALDMDSKALEAMAGLARLYRAEGKLADAFSWIDQCYRELAKGRVFLAEDPAEFKSAVREKRREFAREAGIRPEEDAVEIRFRVETSEHPKNRPCPCGSGKKYKLCCMKNEPT